MRPILFRKKTTTKKEFIRLSKGAHFIVAMFIVGLFLFVCLFVVHSYPVDDAVCMIHSMISFITHWPQAKPQKVN